MTKIYQWLKISTKPNNLRSFSKSRGRKKFLVYICGMIMNIIFGDETGLAHGSYRGANFDLRWLEKRKKILKRDNYECQVCKSKENLQVHHRQYLFSRRKQRMHYPWEYPDRLLITLCESCHQKGHKLFKVPIKHI